MSKYTYKNIEREISGFGGGYEKSCRNMVIAGMEWLDAHPEAKPTFKQYANVYGITAEENNDMEAMQAAMLRVCDDCTGAMMQACTNHVLKAREVGWEEYTRLMNEADANS